MTTAQPLTPLQQAIINVLETGDCTAGNLLDATKCSSYAELNAALKSLQNQNRISYYFTEAPVLMYKLAPQPQRVMGWFQRDI